MEPDAAEIRVLGCLIEKQRTTPDAYPLTLNSLRLACNQSTNRDPLVDYDEATIRDALERLGKRGWTRLATWSNRRTMKYRHLFDEALGLSEAEIGAALRAHAARAPDLGRAQAAQRAAAPFPDTGEVERVLEASPSAASWGGLTGRPGRAGPPLRAAPGGWGRGVRPDQRRPPSAAADEAPPAAAAGCRGPRSPASRRGPRRSCGEPRSRSSGDDGRERARAGR